MAAAIGWQANRSSPRKTGRQMRHRRTMPRQPALGGVAFAVLLLRSVLGRDELRRQRQDLLVAGRDDGGARKAWKYSVPPSERRRVEQRWQWILREQKCSVPSSAISTRPPRRWNGASTPSVSIALVEQRIERRRWGAVQHQADIGCRVGMADMPNRVWQFDRPCPSSSARWCARNDGLPMKNSENADRPMSAIV